MRDRRARFEWGNGLSPACEWITCRPNRGFPREGKFLFWVEYNREGPGGHMPELRENLLNRQFEHCADAHPHRLIVGPSN